MLSDTPPQSLPDMFEGSFSSGDRWIVLRTRSRQEKAVAAELASRCIRHFLPLIQRVRYHGRRKFKVDEPLFGGYLFMRGSIEQAYEVDRTRRIASILNTGNQGSLNTELKSLSIASAQNAAFIPHPYLKVGRFVEVRAGPLRGMQGQIESVRGAASRLIINVDILGRAVSLEIDGSLLDLI